MPKKPQPVSWYDMILKQKMPKTPLFTNSLKAFGFGGALCAFIQLCQFLLINYGGMDKDGAGVITTISIIFLAAFFTGLGYYDMLAQKVGAGLAVPITGFANSMTAAAIEHKAEGWVLGVGCNSFKLAGAVIVFGICSAGIVALVKLVLGVI